MYGVWDRTASLSSAANTSIRAYRAQSNRAQSNWYRRNIEKHDNKGVIVAVEMTGTYQKTAIAVRAAGYEIRLVES